MSTKLYFQSTASSPITPAVSAQWDYSISAFARYPTSITKASQTLQFISLDGNGDGADNDYCFGQWISPALDAQTIGGSGVYVKIQMRCMEEAARVNAFLTATVRILSGDGSTVRGTVCTLTRDNTEMVATTTEALATNRAWAMADTTAVSAQEGDRIVIEVGSGGDPSTGSGGNSHDSDICIGDASGTDLLIDNDMEVTNNNPYCLFEDDITFYTAGTATSDTRDGRTQGSDEADDTRDGRTQGSDTTDDTRDGRTIGIGDAVETIDYYIAGAIAYELYAGVEMKAQSFAVPYFFMTLDNMAFKIKKKGLPLGEMYAELWTHTGTFGVSSKPLAFVARSDSKNIASLTLSTVETQFDFTDDDRAALDPDQNYCAVLKYDAGNSSNCLVMLVDSATPTHHGNAATYSGTTWTDQVGIDCWFKVRARPRVDTEDERDGRTHGSDQASDTRDGRTEGTTAGTATSDTRDGRTQGSDISDDTRDGRTEGIGVTDDVRDGRTQGSDTTDDVRDGRTEGIGFADDERDGRTQGSEIADDTRDGRTQGSQAADDTRDGRTEGSSEGTQTSDTRDGRTRASDITDDVRDGRTQGSDETEDTRDGRTEGAGLTDDVRDGRTQGSDVTDDTRDGRTESVGITSDERDGRTEGAGVTSDVRDGRTQGSDVADDVRDGRTQGSDVSSDTRDGRTEGSSEGTQASDTRDGRTEGVGFADDVRDGRTHGSDTAEDTRDGRTEGIGLADDIRDGRTQGSDVSYDTRDCRTQGSETASDTRDGRTSALGFADDIRDGRTRGSDTTSDTRDGRTCGAIAASSIRDGRTEGSSTEGGLEDVLYSEIRSLVRWMSKDVEGLKITDNLLGHYIINGQRFITSRLKLPEFYKEMDMTYTGAATSVTLPSTVGWFFMAELDDDSRTPVPLLDADDKTMQANQGSSYYCYLVGRDLYLRSEGSPPDADVDLILTGTPLIAKAYEYTNELGVTENTMPEHYRELLIQYLMWKLRISTATRSEHFQVGRMWKEEFLQELSLYTGEREGVGRRDSIYTTFPKDALS